MVRFVASLSTSLLLIPAISMPGVSAAANAGLEPTISADRWNRHWAADSVAASASG